MNKRTLAAALGFLMALGAFSQEMLKPLSSNINYYYGGLAPVEKAAPAQQGRQKAAAASLSLPFKEDFSYSPVSAYPVQSLWIDSGVYINSGFGRAPMSLGVATFDGLNKHGYPYTPNIASTSFSAKADTLTSRPINLRVSGSQTLQPTDKVAMTFYYQAGGFGDFPENNDSLVLDFYSPNQKKWYGTQWSKIGPGSPNLNDSLFKRAFVWIRDTTFLQDGFQFRFRNTATTNGDFDHWNIDYIYINRNRDSIADTAYNDVGFAALPSSFLKRYSAMPYKQYDSLTEMAQFCSVRIRSNKIQQSPLAYSYSMPLSKYNSSLVYNYADNSQIDPFNVAAYCCASPNNIANAQVNKKFQPMSEPWDFRIRHTSKQVDTSDIFKGNDTVTQYQRFRNYYAFDDGSAEAGYYVLGVGGKMAVKIELHQPDTLVGVQVYFEHVGTISAKPAFTLSVWSAASNGPGTLIYGDTTRTPVYKQTGFKEIPEYTLSVPKILPAGTYYVGFKQGVQTGISVGYDVNYDHRSSLYFDSGSGWNQSQFYGSLMMRPVFGSFNAQPVGIRESGIDAEKQVLVYPNPSNAWLTIASENFSNRSVSLLNALGQVVKSEALASQQHLVNTAELPNGVYFLLVQQEGRQVYSQKIIISH